MSSGRILLAAMTMALLIAAPARAQFNPWPQPLPSDPIWGDYDEGHAWHDAGWWSNNRPDWARAHHPEWWGDYDDDHIWQPAAWWRNNRPAWVRAQTLNGGATTTRAPGTRRRGGSAIRGNGRGFITLNGGAISTRMATGSRLVGGHKISPVG